MRDNPAVSARLAALPRTDRTVVCSIVRGEILFGIHRLPRGRRRRALEARAAFLFSGFPCEPISGAAGDQYAVLKLTQERQGLALDVNDLWIAATALTLDAVLV